MDKKKIIIIAIAIILMIIIGAITSCSCGNSKKSPITKSSQEISSDEVSTEQSTENEEVETTNLETTTSDAEETTTPAVTEEVTTKPVVQEEKTTAKSTKQTTSKKENQTKPAQETTKATVNPNQFTYEIWDEPVTYIFSDEIKEQINMYALPSKDSQVRGWHTSGGMKVEIIGVCKENGWYVVAGDELMYVSNEYKIIKKASIDDPFDDYASMEDYIDGLYIGNPYLGRLYLFYPGESSVSGEEVKIYDNRKIEDLLYVYSCIMPKYVTHYYNPEEGYYGTETIEQLIKLTFGEDSTWTVQHYKNGEALAKYYGLDFHSDVEALK